MAGIGAKSAFLCQNAARSPASRRRASERRSLSGRYDPGVEQRIDAAGLDRFSGFASLYDANRPCPPVALGPLLCAYAGEERPEVVDVGSGTGLSTRWAARWASSVIGVEPNADMRSAAESHLTPGVAYRAGTAQDTGLDAASADVAVVVQAMHWMDPDPTLAEISRVLRPGGILAVVDADWPPVSGVVGAEQAWALLHRRIRVLEARVARGETGRELRRAVPDDDPLLADDDLADPHRNRLLPGGLKSWSKSEHLARIEASGRFAYARELALSEAVEGGEERFVALMLSQGSYQGLRRRGLSDDDIGASDFERQVRSAFAEARSFAGLSFTWRVRLGVASR